MPFPLLMFCGRQHQFHNFKSVFGNAGAQIVSDTPKAKTVINRNILAQTADINFALALNIVNRYIAAINVLVKNNNAFGCLHQFSDFINIDFRGAFNVYILC